MCICYSFQFSVFLGFQGAHNSESLFLVLSLELFSFCLFFSCSNVLAFALLYCILLLYLRSLLSFLTTDRERWEGRKGGPGRSRERRTSDECVLCEKKKLFSIKRKTYFWATKYYIKNTYELHSRHFLKGIADLFFLAKYFSFQDTENPVDEG